MISAVFNTHTATSAFCGTWGEGHNDDTRRKHGPQRESVRVSGEKENAAASCVMISPQQRARAAPLYKLSKKYWKSVSGTRTSCTGGTGNLHAACLPPATTAPRTLDARLAGMVPATEFFMIILDVLRSAPVLCHKEEHTTLL